MIVTARVRFASSILVASVLAAAAGCGPAAAEPQAGGIALASHLAIYDLKLANSRGKRSLEAVQGRIVYDFSSACEGYGLQFRQVTSLDSGEGKTALSDLRATSWEDAEAKSFRFRISWMNAWSRTSTATRNASPTASPSSSPSPSRSTSTPGRRCFPPSTCATFSRPPMTESRYCS